MGSGEVMCSICDVAVRAAHSIAQEEEVGHATMRVESTEGTGDFLGSVYSNQ